MPNNLSSNTSQIVLRKFLPGFMSDLVSCKTVNRQIVSDGDLNPRTGSTIEVKRPHQYQVFRTADGDMTGNNSPVISGKAQATVQQYITVPVESTDIEQALESDQWDEVLRPVRTRMITTLETSLNQFMLQNSSHLLGAAGTQISKWSDIGEVNAFMQSFGIPNDMRYAQINPYGQVGLADAQAGLASGSNDLVDTAWKRAQITRDFGGLMAYTSNALNAVTSGDQVSNAGITVAAPPIQTYTATKDTYTMVLSLTGLTPTTGTIVAGDVLELSAAGVGQVVWLNQETKQPFTDQAGNFINWTATVLTGGTADGGGNLTVTVTGPAIFEPTEAAYNSVSQAIAAGDGVTVISAATDNGITQPNLFYHRDAFGLCTVNLKPLKGWDSSVVGHEGFSIRLTQFSDATANTHGWRFDLLPAFAAYNPYMAGRFFGRP